MGLLNPWILLALVLALAGASVGGYVKGHSDAAASCQVEKNVMVQKANEIAMQESAKAIEQSSKLEDQHAKAQVVYRTITQQVDKIVERPVYRNVCFDDDGLHAVNDAIAGKVTDPSKPDSAVPGDKSSGKLDGGNSNPKVN